MKKNGILNSEIDKVLADLGHTDQIVIGDCGLPIPPGVQKIDLALKVGVPSFEDVLEVIREEMVIEKVILAQEIKDQNQLQLEKVTELLPTQETEFVTHEQFKQISANAKAIIRTGEASPYSNIILQSGVFF